MKSRLVGARVFPLAVEKEVASLAQAFSPADAFCLPCGFSSASCMASSWLWFKNPFYASLSSWHRAAVRDVEEFYDSDPLPLSDFWSPPCSCEASLGGEFFPSKRDGIRRDSASPGHPSRLLTIFAVVFFSPLFEEILWRRILVPALLRMGSLFTALLIAGVHFGLVHYYFGLFSVVSKSLLGLRWSWVAMVDRRNFGISLMSPALQLCCCFFWEVKERNGLESREKKRLELGTPQREEEQ